MLKALFIERSHCVYCSILFIQNQSTRREQLPPTLCSILLWSETFSRVNHHQNGAFSREQCCAGKERQADVGKVLKECSMKHTTWFKHLDTGRTAGIPPVYVSDISIKKRVIKHYNWEIEWFVSKASSQPEGSTWRHEPYSKGKEESTTRNPN